MNILTPSYIGREITIKSIRDFILDAQVTQEDTILLHPFNFGDIVREYKREYGTDIKFPYLLIGVLIKEDADDVVPESRVVVVKDDTESLRVPAEEIFDPNEVIYRCGSCGNLVDEDGSQLSDEEWHRKRNYAIKWGDRALVEKVRGTCCKQYY